MKKVAVVFGLMILILPVPLYYGISVIKLYMVNDWKIEKWKFNQFSWRYNPYEEQIKEYGDRRFRERLDKNYHLIQSFDVVTNDAEKKRNTIQEFSLIPLTMRFTYEYTY